MRERPDPLIGRRTFHECLDEVVLSAKQRGLEPHVLDGVWQRPVKALKRYFHGELTLQEITVDRVRTYALWCLDGDHTPDGRGRPTRKPISPSTVRKEYLRVLQATCELANVQSPVPAVLRTLAQRFRRAAAPVIGFDLAEVSEILGRIRAWPELNDRDPELDWLLFALTATTGLRCAELARVRVGDIDLSKAVIVVQPKSREYPRLEPVAVELLEPLRKRCTQLASPTAPIVPARGKVGRKDPIWQPQARYLNRMCTVWQQRLGVRRLNLRALRRAHGSGLDAQGAPYAVVRDSLGHSRTSDETPRYLLTKQRDVNAAKAQLSARILSPEPGDKP